MPELLTTKKAHRVLDKQLTKVWGTDVALSEWVLLIWEQPYHEP